MSRFRHAFLTTAIMTSLTLSPSMTATAKGQEETTKTAGKDFSLVRLITLDPGHFHAALVQKTMYEGVAPVVHVYAPPGPDVRDHLDRIESFNTRPENPTSWKEIVYTGDDFLERMLESRPGNVVVISGRNRKKVDYIKACADAGLNVLADKPMCVDADGYRTLERAFEAAEEHDTLIYDIMTERSEITTILQKKLSHDAAVFGELKQGTREDPAIVKSSVHHFFKNVAGRPLKRPDWYFDTTQQGEGIVDVTTHLVDLVMWAAFPDQIIDFESDIRLVHARRWPTMITREQYEKVTHLEDFPDFLQSDLDENGVLPVFANGELIYTLRGVHVLVRVEWAFQAPPGAGDTHYSIMRGEKAEIIIRQGADENYRPALYVRPVAEVDREKWLNDLRLAVLALQDEYPGVRLVKDGSEWRITIPDRYRVGHEAHFAEVMERYLNYLESGGLPEWEAPNMKAKYRLITTALERARDG